MSDFRINGKAASAGDFHALCEAIEELSSGAFELYISASDNELTYGEICGLLDNDRDGRMTFCDLNGLNAEGFRDINSLLGKHGFSLSEELAPLYSDVFNVSAHLWSVREFVLAVVSRNGQYLRFADLNIQNDPEVVRVAIEQNALALEFASPFLQADRDIVCAAVSKNGMALQYADPALQRDREMVHAAIQERSMAFEYADESLRSDRGFILEALRRGVSLLGFKYVPVDRELLAEAAKIDISVLLCYGVDKDHVEYAWDKIMEAHSERFHRVFGGRKLDSFYDMRKALKDIYDIEFLERFRSVETLLDVLERRRAPGAAVGRTAVVVSAKLDNNGAFESFPTIDRLKALGFDVLYYEAGDEKGVRRALEDATARGERKASVVVLSGHGSPTTISLSGEDMGSGGEMSDEKLYIDVSDISDGRDELKLSRYIVPGGDLILDSCSNGEGSWSNSGNLANRMADVLPGVRVHSATEPMNIEGLTLDEDLRPRVKWSAGEVYIPLRNNRHRY